MECIPQLTWTSCNPSTFHLFYICSAVALTIYFGNLIIQFFALSRAMDNRRPLGYLIAQVVASAFGILYQAFMWNKELPSNVVIILMKYCYSMIPLIIPQLTFWYWEAGMLTHSSKWPFVIMVFVNVVLVMVSLGGIYIDYFKFVRVFFANNMLTAISSFIITTYVYVKHDNVNKGKLILGTLTATLTILTVNLGGLIIVEYVKTMVWLWYLYYFVMVVVTNMQSVVVCVDYLRNHHNYNTIPSL